MGLPNINITFSTAARNSIARSQKGVVAVILKDSAATGAHILTNVSQIPTALSAANKTYLRQAFLGYVTPPRKVIAYVLEADAEDYSEALDYFATQQFDYLVGAPDCDATQAAEIATWITAQRAAGAIYKAVLPDKAADSEAIINFAAEGMTDGTNTYTTAAYCARIAGLIAGTPMNISCTYAPLPELTDIKRLTKDEMDEAIDAGKLILMHDGQKVKVARGVNSLQTTSDSKGPSFKKIKIVEAVDMIRRDITRTAQDTYIGKYANTYDNKMVLCTAISDYFKTLEQAGILRSGGSSVGIDVEAQEAYLQSKGIDTSDMSEQEIKEYNTDDQVLLKATISILDAIEDIALAITI